MEKATKVNILGSEWSIFRRERDIDETLKDCDGYTDNTTRSIIVAIAKREPGHVEGVEAYMMKVTRHEIVHAFLSESGLNVNSLPCEEGWAMNEEMVDWIAIQGPKIYKAWQEAGAL